MPTTPWVPLPTASRRQSSPCRWPTFPSWVPSPLRLLTSLLGLTLAGGLAHAQTDGVDPGFAVGAGPDQRVFGLAIQQDQKVLVVGEFQNFAGVPRGRIVRLDPNGGLDPSFDAGVGANGSVNQALVLPDTKLLAVGSFTLMRGETRNRVVRFLANGTLDPEFNVGTGPNTDVYAVVREPNGDLIIGGAFTVVAGQPRQYLARLKPNGALDPAFNPQANSTVWTLARTAEGKLLLGGDFTRVAGEVRIRVARLLSNGSLDPDFDPAAGPNSSVRTLVALPDGQSLIGGAFTEVNGSARPYLSRLTTNGLPDGRFAAVINSTVYAAAVQPDGRILIGGDFTQASGQNVNRLARLLVDGNFDPSFAVGTGANSTVHALARLTDGKVLAGGSFTDFNGPNRPRLVRVLTTTSAAGGEVEFSAGQYGGPEGQPGALFEVRRTGLSTAAISVSYATANGTATNTDYAPRIGTMNFAAGETSKSILVPYVPDDLAENDETVTLTLSSPTGGAVLGGQRTAVIRIENDDQASTPGAVDTTYGKGATGPVYASAIQPDGKVVVVGDFTGLGDSSRLRIARLRVDGSLDPAFLPAAWLNSTPSAVAIQPDGRILVGGAFTIANGATRIRLVRLQSDGSLDNTFNPGIGPNNTVNAILPLGDGSILVAGSFATFAGDGPGFLVRLFSNGLVDFSFNPRVNGAVWALLRTPAGQILIGGDFTSVQGLPRNRLARLNAGGTLDTTFDPGTGPNSTVRALALQADGKLLIGGAFSDVSGTGRTYLSRMEANGLVDPSYLGSANTPVYALALQPDGKALVGGEFSVLSGVPLNRLGRLLPDGALDPSFNVGTGAPTTVFTVAAQSNGGVLVGGAHTQFDVFQFPRLTRLLGRSAAPGGELEFSVARFPFAEGAGNAVIEVRRTGPATLPVTVSYATVPGTATPGDYNPQVSQLTFAIGEVKKTFTVSLVPDAQIEDDEILTLTLSNPSEGASLGGQRSAVLVILNDDLPPGVGGVDLSYSGGVNGTAVYATALQADGKLIVAGEFPGLVDGTRLRLARLTTAGALDPAFNPATWLNGSILAVALQPDGRILVGGTFTVVNGLTRTRIARFLADGTLDPSFDPGVGPNNSVNALRVLPDGSILAGGSFNTFNTEGGAYLVRLFSDGDLDVRFRPGLNAPVWSLAGALGGKFLVAGDFTVASGRLQSRIARFNPDSTLDPSFDPGAGPNSSVRAMVQQADGKLLIGGNFTDLNGTGRTYLARLNADGLPDVGYVGTANSPIYALAQQTDGKLVIGGDFTSVSGSPANRLARLLSDGAIDPSFVIGVGANNSVFTVALAPGGTVVAGGAFTQFSGLSRPRLVRLRGIPTGGEFEFSAPFYSVSEAQSLATITVVRTGPLNTVATVDYNTTDGTANGTDYVPQFGRLTFGLGVSQQSFTVPILADIQIEDRKTVLLTLVSPNGGPTLGGQRNAVLGLVDDDSTVAIGRVDTTYGAGALGPIYASALQADGKVVVVGDFSGFSSGARLRIARLLESGQLDDSFEPSAWLNGAVTALAIQPDGRILVGGNFTVANGFSRNRLARFESDGTLDQSFNPGLGPNNVVNSLLVLDDGRILVGGAFNTFNVESGAFLVRLFDDGLVDFDFNPGVNANVQTMALAPGGKLVIGGDFTIVQGTARNRIARLNLDGSLDLAFNPAVGPNSTVRALVVQSDSKVVMGGSFSDVNGAGHSFVCRLNADGLPDPGHSGAANSTVYALALLADNRVVVGGEFTQLSGQPANRVMQLLADGKPDPGFVIGQGANGTVHTLTLQEDGKLIVAGAFTQFDGFNRSRIVRLYGTPPPAGVRFRFTSITTVGTQIRMLGNAGAGQSYRLEYSLDLETWVPLSTKTATGSTLEFTDDNPPHVSRTYRVRTF